MTKKDDIPEISQRIRQLREQRDLSQRALAKLAGVTDAAITFWEGGKRFPRGKNLKNLAAALGVSESVILEGAEKPTPTTSNKSGLILEIQDILRTLSESQLETLKASAENLKSLSQNKNHKSKAD